MFHRALSDDFFFVVSRRRTKTGDVLTRGHDASVDKLIKIDGDTTSKCPQLIEGVSQVRGNTALQLRVCCSLDHGHYRITRPLVQSFLIDRNSMHQTSNTHIHHTKM